MERRGVERGLDPVSTAGMGRFVRGDMFDRIGIDGLGVCVVNGRTVTVDVRVESLKINSTMVLSSCARFFTCGERIFFLVYIRAAGHWLMIGIVVVECSP